MENFNQSPTVPPQEPEQFNSSRFSKPVIISLVIIGVFVVGYFALAKYQSWWPFGSNGQINQPVADGQIESQNPSPTQESVQWSTASACTYLDGKKDISFSYPTQLQLDTTSLKNNCLSIDPGLPNFILPVTNNAEIIAAELTTDLKNIFYIKIRKDSAGTTYVLYRADMQNRKLVQLNTYIIKGNYQPEYNIAFNSLMPRVVEGFLTYNWFIKDPTTTKYVGRSTDFLRGKVASLQTNLELFTSPCDVEFSTFPPTFDIAPDGKHIALECKDGIFLSDWKITNQVSLPTSIGTATRIYFVDASHIGFVDSSKELEGCRFPSYSIDFNGQNLKEIGDQYMCY